jgi:serine/threonine-protein kinase PknK
VRLEARLLYESVRIATLSGEPIGKSLAARVRAQGAHKLDATGADVAELKEDSQIRLLVLDGEPPALSEACARARARLDHVDKSKRPRAHLHATIQLARCLAVTGDTDEAQRVLAPALRTCAALGLSRLLIDEGPQMLRVAADTVNTDEFSSADPTTSENVREFVLSLAETSPV